MRRLTEHKNQIISYKEETDTFYSEIEISCEVKQLKSNSLLELTTQIDLYIENKRQSFIPFTYITYNEGYVNTVNVIEINDNGRYVCEGGVNEFYMHINHSYDRIKRDKPLEFDGKVIEKIEALIQEEKDFRNKIKEQIFLELKNLKPINLSNFIK